MGGLGGVGRGTAAFLGLFVYMIQGRQDFKRFPGFIIVCLLEGLVNILLLWERARSWREGVSFLRLF